MLRTEHTMMEGLEKKPPLYKSHEERGFEEPIWYFDYEQSNLHGISDVSKNYFWR